MNQQYCIRKCNSDTENMYNNNKELIPMSEDDEQNIQINNLNKQKKIQTSE